jgi:hypothetical protein
VRAFLNSKAGLWVLIGIVLVGVAAIVALNLAVILAQPSVVPHPLGR